MATTTTAVAANTWVDCGAGTAFYIGDINTAWVRSASAGSVPTDATEAVPIQVFRAPNGLINWGQSGNLFILTHQATTVIGLS